MYCRNTFVRRACNDSSRGIPHGKRRHPRKRRPQKRPGKNQIEAPVIYKELRERHYLAPRRLHLVEEHERPWLYGATGNKRQSGNHLVGTLRTCKKRAVFLRVEEVHLYERAVLLACESAHRERLAGLPRAQQQQHLPFRRAFPFHERFGHLSFEHGCSVRVTSPRCRHPILHASKPESNADILRLKRNTLKPFCVQNGKMANNGKAADRQRRRRLAQSPGSCPPPG